MPESTERSLGDLFGELSRETGQLLRKELELAQVEMSRKLSRTARRVAVLVVGGAIVYAGVLALTAALVLALIRTGAPPWASALLVGGLVLAAGGLVVQQTLAVLRAESMAPTETMRTMRETAEWMVDRT